MRPELDSRRSWMDAERWLSNAWTRWAIVLLLVALATAVTSAQRYEFATMREGVEVELFALVGVQFASWLAWALVGALLLRLAGLLMSRSGSLLAVVALQVPLSLLVSVGMVYVDEWLSDQFPSIARTEPRRGDGEGEGERRGGRGGRGRFGGADSTRRRMAFRLPGNLFIYWVVLGIGAGAAVYRRTRREERRATELELRAVKLDAELADAQMASLRAQLHPHFLFNALHTVGGLVREGREEDALKTLAAIGELLRTTLDQGEQHELRLADEIRVARRYLEIEARRLGDRLEVEWQIEEGCGDARVPALFLLPLIENAVRHGVAPRTEGGRLRIAVSRAGAQLCVEVADDGPGFPAAVLAGESLEGEGDDRRRIGLSNDRERLAMLYGDDQRFELLNPPEGGATVRVRMPFRTGAEGASDA